MSDTEITCQDCSTPFLFSAQEQEFYAEKGFTPPKRCKHCRDVRKQGRGEGGQGGGYGGGGSRPPRSENRGGGRGNGSSGGGRGGDRPMYDAVCADCGANCQVPFQPKSDRPVYCRECFSQTRR